MTHGDKVSHRRTTTLSLVGHHCPNGEQVVSPDRAPGASYNESNLLSPSKSPLDNNLVTTVGVDGIPEHEVRTSILAHRERRQSERFLAGPIPLTAIVTAGGLPGSALLVFLAIHHRIRVTGKPWVTLPATTMIEFNFGRNVKSRALTHLERAGLIRVRRKTGCAVVISLAPLRRSKSDDQR